MSSKFLSNNELKKILEKATLEERFSLTRLLDKEQQNAYNSKKLQEEICWEGGNGFVNLLWRQGDGTGYLDIVDDVLDELKILGAPSYRFQVRHYDEIEELKYDKKEASKKGIEYAEKYEEKIILKLLEITYEKMSNEEKISFDEQINQLADKYTSNTARNLSGVGGLMILANLGGFTTYTLLTTIMSTVTLGTLGFGVYTAATTLLSVILGPVGWAGLGVAAAFTIGKPDYQKLIPLVAVIGAIRQRIKYDENLERI